MSGTARIEDLLVEITNGPRTAFVRAHFGISAFGVNAFAGSEPGDEVISEHDELGKRAGHHQELYFVSTGHATFTVDGDEIDAPAGTFVFVRDPAARRGAVAREAGTIVVAAGGKPDEAFTPSSWERNAPVLLHFANKEYDEAIEELERLRAETPEDATVLYNLACAKSLTGRKDEAIEDLRRSIEVDPDFRNLAEKDSDLDPIRDDPRFASAIAGKPDSAASGA